MADRPHPWQPGDRVIVRLPDRNLRQGGSGFRQVDVHGTVSEIDMPGQPPGVKVDLDREVNGVSDCYATHGELRPEVPDA